MFLPRPANGLIRISFASRLLFHKIPLLFILVLYAQRGFTQKIDIKSGAQLVMKGRPFLVINNAALTNNGVFVSDSGTVKLSGDADSSIAYIDGTSNHQFNNLTINKSANRVALRSSLSIKDSLNITAGILHTNDHLVLLSDEDRTATLSALPVDGSGNATSYVSGKVSIERYLSNKRAWRLLSAPAKSINAPSINQAWQEGVTTASGNPNPHPGYGMHIIGGSVANGYDQGMSGSSSIKIFNNVANTFTGLPAAGTNLPISSYDGYFLFVRGDRSVNIMNPDPAALPTTLRIKAEVKTGDQQVSIHSTGFTLLGNPYPAAINFGSITRTNVRNQFYTWDPYLDGNYGNGAWVTVSWNGTGYDATPSVSTVSACIPSGAAVFVQADNTALPASIKIKESDKTHCNTQAPLAGRTVVTGKLRTALFESNSNGSKTLLDGLITTFDDAFSNNIDAFDAPKMAAKYISQKRNGKLFSIERRQAIQNQDTIFLQLTQVPARNYEMQFLFEGMEGQVVEAVLKDNFSASLNNRLLSLSDTNFIAFDVTSNPASAAANRFMIVFKQLQVLPVSFTQIKAAENAAGILVQWETEQEVNTKEYVLEKSLNGTNFYPIHTQVAKGNGGTNKNVYQYQDNAAIAGIQYYRVKAIDADGSSSQSKTVAVTIVNTNNGIIVFPNPVTANHINLQTNAATKGNYHYRLLNNNGQVLLKGTFQIQQSHQQVQLPIASSIPKGIYQLEIQQTAQPAVLHKIILQ